MRWMLAAALAAALTTLPLPARETDAPVRRFVAEAEGTLTIEPDGRVSATTLPDELTPALREAYAEAIRRWTFEPILLDGKPVRALGHMRLSLAIHAKGDVVDRASIERVTFVDGPDDGDSMLGPDARMHPPSYPMGLAREGIGGEVLLAVETDADGRVVRAAPLSGNLYAEIRARDAARAERAFGQFARASVQAAKNWSLPGCRSSVCTVPVRYTVSASLDRGPFWRPAYAVPVVPEPWMMGAGVLALGADGAASSPRFQPKTPLTGAAAVNADG